MMDSFLKYARERLKVLEEEREKRLDTVKNNKAILRVLDVLIGALEDSIHGVKCKEE